MALRLEYLEGDGGDYPLVRIFGRDPQAVAAIIDIIAGLSVVCSDPVRLPVKYFEQSSCALSVVLSKSRTEVRKQPGSRDFVWAISEHEQAQAMELLEPFLTAEMQDRFQWLCEPQSGLGATEGKVALVITTNEQGRW